MSLGDLYHKNKISLVGAIQPHRFLKNRLPDQRVVGWVAELQFLRALWEEGSSTELETGFFEWFDPSQKPPPWPDRLTR